MTTGASDAVDEHRKELVRVGDDGDGVGSGGIADAEMATEGGGGCLSEAEGIWVGESGR